MDIDVVITWVDGKDKKHKKKLKKHLKSKRKEVPGANKTRFRSVNEIRYCVLSILKFAPFVRNIYIVTDNQKPNLNKYINKLYPNKINSIKVVDHKEIFEGYEEYLPTFNARAIETVVWRIKGLSDNFVYFNDDFFIVKEIKPEDWFLNKKPIMRGHWSFRPIFIIWFKKIVQILKTIKQGKNAEVKPTFKTSQWWAARKLGFRVKYFKINHTPHPLNKLRIKQFYEKNEKILLENISHKFRYYTQYNPATLANHIEIKNGNKQFKPYDAVYLKPVNRGKNYVDKKIRACGKENIKYMCAQSLDMATEQDRKKLLGWLEQLIKK